MVKTESSSGFCFVLRKGYYMKFRIMTAFVALIMVLSIGLAGCNRDTGDSLDRVLNSGTLTVVGSGGYPPFNYIADDGSVIGFDVDTGKEIAERLGVELDYVTSDWDGLTEGLISGRYDGILGSMAITYDRQKEVNFTVPYYYSSAQLIVRKDAGISSPEDMAGKEVAVVTGTNFVRDAEDLGAEAVLYQDDNATLMDLIAGRVDGVITDRLVAVRAINEMQGGDQLEISGEVLRLEEMAIAINKHDMSLLEKINEILEEMHEDGTMAAISEDWFDGQDITVR